MSSLIMLMAMFVGIASSFHAPLPGRVGISALRLHAKKKGGSTRKPAKGGMAWALDFKVNPMDSSALRSLAETAVGCYQTRTGKPLHADLVGVTDLPKALWAISVALVIVATAEDSGRTSEAPPLVLYANRAGLEALGVAKPDSNFDAVINQRPEGLQLPTSLPAAGTQFESSYTKKYLARGGAAADATVKCAARWVVEKATVQGGALQMATCGVAYAFEEWFEGDLTSVGGYVICRPGGVREAPAPPPVSAAELAASAVAQAACVRALKEERGLAKGAPELDAAVKELLRLKAALEAATKAGAP
jgi:hypothetical protein